jgi:hypothetical protein
MNFAKHLVVTFLVTSKKSQRQFCHPERRCVTQTLLDSGPTRKGFSTSQTREALEVYKITFIPLYTRKKSSKLEESLALQKLERFQPVQFSFAL